MASHHNFNVLSPSSQTILSNNSSPIESPIQSPAQSKSESSTGSSKYVIEETDPHYQEDFFMQKKFLDVAHR